MRPYSGAGDRSTPAALTWKAVENSVRHVSGRMCKWAPPQGWAGLQAQPRGRPHKAGENFGSTSSGEVISGIFVAFVNEEEQNIEFEKRSQCVTRDGADQKVLQKLVWIHLPLNARGKRCVSLCKLVELVNLEMRSINSIHINGRAMKWNPCEEFYFGIHEMDICIRLRVSK